MSALTASQILGIALLQRRYGWSDLQIIELLDSRVHFGNGPDTRSRNE